MELIKNREGYLVSNTQRECTSCGTIFDITSKMTLCKSCNSKRVKSKSPEWKMHQRAKQRCKKSGLIFELNLEDIIIPDYCPILNIRLQSHSGKSGYYKNSPSLDRIDNKLGYIKSNIWVISTLANAMKHEANEKELQLFAKWINTRYPA